MCVVLVWACDLYDYLDTAIVLQVPGAGISAAISSGLVAAPSAPADSSTVVLLPSIIGISVNVHCVFVAW
jgi:hypothetical protein